MYVPLKLMTYIDFKKLNKQEQIKLMMVLSTTHQPDFILLHKRMLYGKIKSICLVTHVRCNTRNTISSHRK
jgi:hypothetical protein